MASYHFPQPQPSVPHIHYLLLSFSAFIILCSIKTLQIVMNKPADVSKKSHTVGQKTVHVFGHFALNTLFHTNP